jgi:hypothetical protein
MPDEKSDRDVLKRRFDITTMHGWDQSVFSSSSLQYGSTPTAKGLKQGGRAFSRTQAAKSRTPLQLVLRMQSPECRG